MFDNFMSTLSRMLRRLGRALEIRKRFLSVTLCRVDDSERYTVSFEPPVHDQDPDFDTPKGEFKAEFQGYGNVDRLEEMFYPEWRS